MDYTVIHTFTSALFAGNPAGVCRVEAWPDAALMQRIALENALPETAFILAAPDGWHIRWFTPRFEMDLCGHATLAAGFTVLQRIEPERHAVTFHSPGGPLTVRRQDGRYALNFPARPPAPVPTPPGLEAALGAAVLGCWAARDLIIEVDSAATVAALEPDFGRLGAIPGYMGFVPTAAGGASCASEQEASQHDRACDFVSRFFDPHDAIVEDPVTGSAHCSLIPFWAGRLGKETLAARQLSRRGGVLYCKHLGDRVEMAGEAVLYLEGRLAIEV